MPSLPVDMISCLVPLYSLLSIILNANSFDQGAAS